MCNGFQSRRCALSPCRDYSRSPWCFVYRIPLSDVGEKLKSTADVCCVGCLQVAHMGVTIAAVIHQPSYEIFQMFDDILLLAKGGRTAFYGPEGQVQGYFEKLGYALPHRTNPADVYMDIIAGIKSRIDGPPQTPQVRAYLPPCPLPFLPQLPMLAPFCSHPVQQPILLVKISALYFPWLLYLSHFC